MGFVREVKRIFGGFLSVKNTPFMVEKPDASRALPIFSKNAKCIGIFRAIS
jgi:hypothetical protein